MSTHTSTWSVTGMTCEHCCASVSEELVALRGVRGVTVALDTGTVTVTSKRPLDRAEVQRAVEEAGYALA